MTRLYYTPPTNEIFNELKEKAIELWRTFDYEFGDATKKVNSIKDITNVQDNFMYMVAMFDMGNQRKLSALLSEETRKAIRERMIEGGNEEQYIVF